MKIGDQVKCTIYPTLEEVHGIINRILPNGNFVLTTNEDNEDILILLNEDHITLIKAGNF